MGNSGQNKMRMARWVFSLCVLGVAPAILQAAEPVVIKVFKSATCGCCRKWIDHLRTAGFAVMAEDVADLAQIRARYGVTDKLSSCHTALVEGYVVEGHFPADLISRLLKERPQVVGISVPGMPQGAPGMEGPNPQRYDVVTFDGKGNAKVYASR